MQITEEMEKYLNMVLDEQLQNAYPSTPLDAQFKKDIKFQTLEGLRRSKDTLLSDAFRLATTRNSTPRGADKSIHGGYECPKCGTSLPPGGSCKQHGLPATPRS